MPSQIFPIPNLKAKDLDRELLPQRELVEAFESVGWVYEKSGYERNWEAFCALVASKREKTCEQPIEQKISSLMRVKDSTGEWLVYGVNLRGKDWRQNPRDFYLMEGKITKGNMDGLPEFFKEYDPETEELKSAQIVGHNQVYYIKFTKEKVNELIPFMQEGRRSFVIQMPDGRRQTCSQEQFMDLPYDKLVAELSGFAEYIKMRNKRYNGGN